MTGTAVPQRAWLLFAAMCIIWGIPYLLIRVAVREVSPETLVLARTGLAALLLVPIAAVRGELRPLLRYKTALVAFTTIGVARANKVVVEGTDERTDGVLVGFASRLL
jgi:drug/metabolite transporter (DMT)-like permease